MRTAKDRTEENSQRTRRGTRAKVLEEETDRHPSLDSRAAERPAIDPGQGQNTSLESTQDTSELKRADLTAPKKKAPATAPLDS